MMKYLALLLLIGCTVTPQGKSVDRSNAADLASTGLAYATEAGVEANPAGAVLIPLKLGMGYLAESNMDNCIDRATFAKWSNTFYYGATVNNLAVVAGASAAPVVGLAAGVAYYFNRERIEPRTFSCIPDHPALDKYAEGYEQRDAQLLASAFTEDAVTPWGVGHDEIKQAYQSKVFDLYPTGWLKFREWDGAEGEVWTWNETADGHISGPVDVSITFDGDLIDRLEW